MRSLSGKKLLIIGFVIVLLIGIPLTVYLLQQQQETRTRAEKSTVLSFDPPSSQAAPLQKKVGDIFTLDVNVNPGTNLVSFVRLEIQYDPTKIATEGASAFQPILTTFPAILEGPVFTNDGTTAKIAATLSVGPDPTKALQAPAKAATITFKALAPTDGVPTLVTYGTLTQVLSIGPNDQASEDVLSSVNPAAIIIEADGEATPTPSSEPTATPTVVPTTVSNQNPSCTSLTANATTGTAPLSVSFTVAGNDPDGTINKATFNFGDGTTADLTETGGLGSSSISVTTLKTYTAEGTYSASAVLTDDNGGVSTTENCLQTINVSNPVGSGGATLTPTPTTPTPTMADPGPGNVVLGFGALVAVLTVIGGFLFFML